MTRPRVLVTSLTPWGSEMLREALTRLRSAANDVAIAMEAIAPMSATPERIVDALARRGTGQWAVVNTDGSALMGARQAYEASDPGNAHSILQSMGASSVVVPQRSIPFSVILNLCGMNVARPAVEKPPQVADSVVDPVPTTPLSPSRRWPAKDKTPPPPGDGPASERDYGKSMLMLLVAWFLLRGAK